MITGKTFRLRPWHEADLLKLTTIRNDVVLQSQLLSRVRGTTLEQNRQWLQKRSMSPDSLLFIIADIVTDELFGYIQYTDIDLVSQTAKMGICIDQNYQGKGLGGEALLLSLRHIKNVFSVRKTYLEVRFDNKFAIRCYENIGFKKCGKLHDHFLIDGHFFDLIVMELFLSSI